ncbi:LPO_1073/Vpar_1526 family protein [Saccharospirillum alexandrii]|uniref:LPO_1073/Vpar_1526 family protein n=1 Tax=Saccharospirillum alexandrii TaxID=2448477 RepID=UPI000FDC1525|nr:LPO_1073/Vpar_1526 family protein [Saccharospirillum alexandrii]
MNRKSQSSGDNSNNYQAERMELNFNGISYTDARSIALDTFNENFPKLAEVARKTAEDRAAELFDCFAEKQRYNSDAKMESFSDPAFLSGLFEAQKGYALSGSEKLLSILSECLSKITTTSPGTIQSISLSEAIKAASILTPEQVNSITLLFLADRYQHHLVRDDKSLGLFLDQCYQPFLEIADSRSSILHLQYTGCAFSIDVQATLEKRIKLRYPGLFQTETTTDEINNLKLEIPRYFPLLRDDNSYSQGEILNFNSVIALNRVGVRLGWAQRDIQKLSSLIISKSMPEQHYKESIIKDRPYMLDLFNKWNSSQLTRIDITNIGEAIGYTQMSIHSNIDPEISEWIN